MGILLLLLAVFAVGGKKVSAAEEDRDVQYTIGVVVYNQNSPEMNMFMNYYREYIQQGFPVKFYFSGSINSAEDEINFIRAMKLQGVSGIISFYLVIIFIADTSGTKNIIHFFFITGFYNLLNILSIKRNDSAYALQLHCADKIDLVLCRINAA